ncbi:22171_t:CDS:2, partial [Cetraspora pellucida]
MAQICEHREWLDSATRNNQIIKYNYNAFNEINSIGHGSFGRVSSAISSKFKSKVALKSVKINSDFTIELLVNELKQHIRLGSHNNILEFYGIIEDEPDIFILVLEYANNGTLKEYLCKNFCVLNWDDKLDLARQLVNSIQFLHSHDIIHRDLHSDNVLIHDKIVKLSDFGNSKFTADPSIQLTKGLGSMRYSDPEFVKNSLNYKKPIHGTPKDYVKIYEECWRSIPDQRPNIEEVKSNLANINIDNVISIEKIEINEKPDISILQGLANRINLQGLTNGIDLQGLTNGVDADSEIFHELYEVLSSTSDIDEEYIDNNIEDSDKQILRQLVQLFSNYINVPE